MPTRLPGLCISASLLLCRFHNQNEVEIIAASITIPRTARAIIARRLSGDVLLLGVSPVIKVGNGTTGMIMRNIPVLVLPTCFGPVVVEAPLPSPASPVVLASARTREGVRLGPQA